MLATYLRLGGSDMNWVIAVFIAVVFVLCIWAVAVTFFQLTRNQVSVFTLFLIFVRIGVVVTISSTVALWMT